MRRTLFLALVCTALLGAVLGIFGSASRPSDNLALAQVDPPCMSCFGSSGEAHLESVQCTQGTNEVVLIALENDDAPTGDFYGNACLLDSSYNYLACLDDADTHLLEDEGSKIAKLTAPSGTNADLVWLWACDGDGTVGKLGPYNYCLDCSESETVCDGSNCGDSEYGVFFTSCQCFSGGSCGGQLLGWQKAQARIKNISNTEAVSLTYWWKYKEHCVIEEDTSATEVTLEPGECITVDKWVQIYSAGNDGVTKLRVVVRSGSEQNLSATRATSCCDDYEGDCTAQCTFGWNCP